MATGGYEDVFKEMQEHLTCTLCMDVWNNPRALPCQHVYCHHCLQQHIAASERAGQIRCPLCNINVTVPQNGVHGFPMAFHQAAEVELYNKIVAINLSSSDTLTDGSNVRVADISTRGATPHTQTGGTRITVAGIPTRNTTPCTVTSRPSTRVADIPTRIASPHTSTVPGTREVDRSTRTTKPNIMTASWKLHQFDIDFEPHGITCTPAGNVVVCGCKCNTVRMYTQEGDKVMDLQTRHQWLEPWDVESTDTNIYVTDKKTESVLVFDHQGRLLTTINISNARRIAGISVSNSKVYISGAGSNNVVEMDLFEANKLSTPRQFAEGVKLTSPFFICSRGDAVAISCQYDHHCVHCVDLCGRIRYTHGTTGQWGNSPNQLNCPWGVVFDNNNTLFISDKVNNRVCAVSDDGRLLGHIDLTRHQLENPRGITIDPEGNLLVACNQARCVASGWCVVRFGYNME